MSHSLRPGLAATRLRVPRPLTGLSALLPCARSWRQGWSCWGRQQWKTSCRCVCRGWMFVAVWLLVCLCVCASLSSDQHHPITATTPQEGVPEAIAALCAAGIRVWVLTGDKMETAISIAHTARCVGVGAAVLLGGDGLLGLRQQCLVLRCLDVLRWLIPSSSTPGCSTPTWPS
jgi:hypothetical protein